MLTEELQNSARALGEALRTSPAVQTYLQAQANCAADLEAADLKNCLLALYQELVGRQQRGEEMQPAVEAIINAINSE